MIPPKTHKVALAAVTHILVLFVPYSLVGSQLDRLHHGRRPPVQLQQVHVHYGRLAVRRSHSSGRLDTGYLVSPCLQIRIVCCRDTAQRDMWVLTAGSTTCTFATTPSSRGGSVAHMYRH